MSPIRILHVAGGMPRAGAETWLMHILRTVDHRKIQMDFLVHTTEKLDYDDEIVALGSRIIPCLHPRQPQRYAKNLKRILAEFGPYDIVHSHPHHFNGFVLRLAAGSGIPIRIAHSHIDTSPVDDQVGLFRKGYLGLMRQWINRYSTVGLAASKNAAASLFGAKWEHDPRWNLLYYGIDLSPFEPVYDCSDIRKELSIPESAIVIGHVGRFVPQKNHDFFVEIAAEIIKQEQDAHFLMIGDGPLRPQIQIKVAELGLDSHFTFEAIRDDIPRLMKGGMDIFLLPSRYEGLPVVLIEAQAAGLPFIASDVITSEADIVHSLSKRLPLTASPVEWAEALIQHYGDHQTERDACLSILKKSPFNIEASAKSLVHYYLQHT